MLTTLNVRVSPRGDQGAVARSGSASSSSHISGGGPTSGGSCSRRGRRSRLAGSFYRAQGRPEHEGVAGYSRQDRAEDIGHLQLGKRPTGDQWRPFGTDIEARLPLLPSLPDPFALIPPSIPAKRQVVQICQRRVQLHHSLKTNDGRFGLWRRTTVRMELPGTILHVVDDVMDPPRACCQACRSGSNPDCRCSAAGLPPDFPTPA